MNSAFDFSKRTKIIATLGPASDNPETIGAMIEAGVDLFRLNASHRAEPEIIAHNVKLIRAVAKKKRRSVGIFLDLQGPKIRIGKFHHKQVEFKSGHKITLVTDTHLVGDEFRASISYSGFVDDVEVDDPLYIDDGKVRLRVAKKIEDGVVCEVEQGGMVSNHKGINLPKTHIRLAAVTAKDKRDCEAAVKNKMDFIALSFVSDETDIHTLREHLDSLGGQHIKIIAKIERPQALDRIVEIINAADVVMVARGDLGVEIGVEHVPRVQKKIIREANKRIKPVIVATQMLESMIHSRSATRAEVSDVANAIYDRCDAVMLSGETAIGIDPAQVIRVMKDICVASDQHMMDIKKEDRWHKDIFVDPSMATSFCRAADQIAEENNARVIMAFTSSGTTPLIASKLNPAFPIIAPTDEQYICQRMAMFRGVYPMMMPKAFSQISRWTDMITLAIREAKHQGLIEKGDKVVVTAGIPIGQSAGINSIRLVTV